LITVTEEVKALIDAQDSPEGTVLRLDPVEMSRSLWASFPACTATT